MDPSTCFVIELRSRSIREFLCIRSRLDEAIVFCSQYDLSQEDEIWTEFAILECRIDPAQSEVHTASQLVKKIEIAHAPPPRLGLL